jgi:5-methylcytosine-specific restriction endonuclease McrA
MIIKFSIELEISKQRSYLTLSGKSWDRLQALVKKRDESTCQYCGALAEDGEPDHVLPLSRGGTDSINNLVWACKSCNRSKKDKTPDEWDGHNIPIRATNDVVVDPPSISHRQITDDEVIDL